MTGASREGGFGEKRAERRRKAMRAYKGILRLPLMAAMARLIDKVSLNEE